MENKMGEIINNPIAENVGNSQIFLPKNSVPVQPVANAIENAVQDVNNNQLSVPAGNYYTLFGMSISKTTIYIIILFLIVSGGYYYIKNKAPVDNKKKNKKSKDNKDNKDKKCKKSKDENKSKTTTSEESK